MALFWKLFETSVESLQIEDFKKHIYLLRCLPEKSVARRAIDLYPPSDENYPRVVEILKKRFWDEKSIVETLQSELLHLPKPSDSVQSLRQFSESIERICQQLSDFGENEQNKFMASTIKSKLPYHLLTQVVEVFRGEEKPRDFPPQIQKNNFQGGGTDFPPNQFRQGHWRPNNRRPNNGNDSVGMMSPRIDRSFLAMQRPQFSQRKTGTRQTCSLCAAVGHPPNRCPKYSTSGTRRRRLAKQRKCFNCLLKGHKAQQCCSPKRCLKCGGKHHYMICRYGDIPKVSTRQTTKETRTVQRKQSSKRRGEPPRSNKTNYSKICVSSVVEDKPSEGHAFDGKSKNGLINVAKKSHALSTMSRVVVKRRDHQRMIENPVVFDQACQTSSQSNFHIEGPFFSARRVNIPDNAEIINDRFFEFGDPERDQEERVPLRREPRVHRQTEPLSSWIERSHGSHWYETILDRRIVDEDLRRELRRGATLIGEHFGRAVDIHFDGLTCYVDPLTPCIQEYVGFSPHEGGMLVDLYPIELVSIRHRVRVRWRAPEEDELHPAARYRAQSPDGHLENRPQRVV
ncbi:hypothetical protein niasHT_025982 [Heterodera trifolii]|uniref:CCHC-type domain-containing protein n=1 Tax=Heterodera trifolii TaxID=157864 RepID=A0ABD2JA79_9BILA